MTTGIGPYVVPEASLLDTDPSGTVLGITINTIEETVNVGDRAAAFMANGETYTPHSASTSAIP